MADLARHSADVALPSHSEVRASFTTSIRKLDEFAEYLSRKVGKAGSACPKGYFGVGDLLQLSGAAP